MKPDLTERLSEDLAALARDAEKMFLDNGDDPMAEAHEIRERLLAALQQTDETISQLGEPSPWGLEKAQQFIRDHPLQTVGLAVGAGLLIGLLVKRK